MTASVAKDGRPFRDRVECDLVRVYEETAVPGNASVDSGTAMRLVTYRQARPTRPWPARSHSFFVGNDPARIVHLVRLSGLNRGKFRSDDYLLRTGQRKRRDSCIVRTGFDRDFESRILYLFTFLHVIVYSENLFHFWKFFLTMADKFGESLNQ
jgi:hypothetical protein